MTTTPTTLPAAFALLRTGTLYRAWMADNPREHAAISATVAGAADPGSFTARSFTGRGLLEYARGRDGHELLSRGRLYQRWAAANPREHQRLLRRLAQPASATPTGRALSALDRLAVRPEPAPVWKRDVVYTANLSAWDGPRRQAAREAGFSVVAVLADRHSDPAAVANLAELKLIRGELERDGWAVVGWAASYTGAELGRSMKHPVALGGGVVVDIDPAPNATRAAELVAAHELDGWITNMEAWNEGEHAWAVGPWVDTYLGRCDAPLAVTPLSSTTAIARSFPYHEFTREHASIQPQVYGNADPGYTVEAALGALEKARVPDTLVSLLLGTYDAGHPIPWADYRTWDGPRGIYLGERITPAEYARLAP